MPGLPPFPRRLRSRASWPSISNVPPAIKVDGQFAGVGVSNFQVTPTEGCTWPYWAWIQARSHSLSTVVVESSATPYRRRGGAFNSSAGSTPSALASRSMIFRLA
jgi:hypothetical protein